MPWKPALEAIGEETRDVRKQRVRDFLRETAKTIDERHVELLGRRAEAPPPEHNWVPLQTVKVVIVGRGYASGYRTLSAKDVWLPSPPVFSPRIKANPSGAAFFSGVVVQFGGRSGAEAVLGPDCVPDRVLKSFANRRVKSRLNS